MICTICDGEFDIEAEGGVEGFIGILPVQFCPTCKAGVFDFVEQHCAHCQELEQLADLDTINPEAVHGIQ